MTDPDTITVNPSHITSPQPQSRLTISWMLIVLVAGVTSGAMWLVNSRGPSGRSIPVIQFDQLPEPVSRAVKSSLVRLQRFPHSAEAWGQLGMVLMAHDIMQEAIDCLQRAEDLDSKSSTTAGYRWPYYQGMCLSLSDPAGALACFERAARAENVPMAVRCELAERLLTVHRIDEAALQLQHPTLPSDEPRIELARGRLGFLRNELATSRRHLERVIRALPQNRDAHQLLSQVLLRLNDRDGAARQAGICQRLGPQRAGWDDPLMNEVVALCQSPSQLLNRADRLQSEGVFSQAALVLERVLELDPSRADVLVQLGYVNIQREANESARTALRRAIELQPDNAEAHYYLGTLAMLDDDWIAARRSLTTAVRCKPDYSAAQFNLGQCSIQLHEPAQAMIQLQVAIQTQPDAIPARLVLARLLMDQGQPSAALLHLEAVARLSPNEPQVAQLRARLASTAH